MHDIHMEMYFPLFLFSCYYFIAVKKRGTLYLLFLTLALLIKEDIAILMFFFGLFLLFKLKERKYGAITAIYSLVYFIISVGIIIPYFRQLEGLKGSYVYDHYGESFFQIAWNILSHPEWFFQNVDFGLFVAKLSNIVSPLLLLPFFSLCIVLAIPPLILAILSKIPQMYTFGIHYSATLLPFLFISLVFGLKNVQSFFNRKRQKKVRNLFLVIFVLFVLINLTNSNFWRLISPSRYKAIKNYKTVSQIIKKIPEDASVAALSAIIPHIPKRCDIFMLPETGDTEYILIHSGINLWPYTKKEFLNLLKRLESGEEYSCIYQKGDAKLFQKN